MVEKNKHRLLNKYVYIIYNIYIYIFTWQMNISLGCSDLILIGYIHSSTKSRKEDGLEDILKFLNVSDAHEEEVGSR